VGVIDDGPSENSAFHIVGTIFDTVWKEGTCDQRPDARRGGARSSICNRPADVVVNLLGSTKGHRVASAVGARRRPPGLVYEVRHIVRHVCGEPPADAEVVTTPATQDALITAIGAALERSIERGPGPVWGAGV